MPIEIRKAHPGEAATLTDLAMRSKKSNGYDDAFMEACREELTVSEADFALRSYWVAIDGNIQGCASLEPDKDGKSGEVSTFFVDPRCQGQGIGRKLWEALLERARADRLRTLHLDADPNAVPFYEAMGFRVTGEAPSGSIPGRMLPHMTISI